MKPLPDSAHQAERNLHLLEAADFRVADRRLQFRLPPEAEREADRLLEEAGIDPHARFFVLAPGASCEARGHDQARYAEVARTLVGKWRVALVVVGSKRERELI